MTDQNNTVEPRRGDHTLHILSAGTSLSLPSITHVGEPFDPFDTHYQQVDFEFAYHARLLSPQGYAPGGPIFGVRYSYTGGDEGNNGSHQNVFEGFAGWHQNIARALFLDFTVMTGYARSFLNYGGGDRPAASHDLLDGLVDSLEDRNGNHIIDAVDTDPFLIDTDGDGLPDVEEDRNQNGLVDAGETDPRRADTDSDGISDFIETGGDGRYDPILGDTDPLNPNTDGDTKMDGEEDINHNGVIELGETDPKNPDTDGDGIPDR